MYSDNKNLKWEHYINPDNNINDIFSYYGISDYTRTKLKISTEIFVCSTKKKITSDYENIGDNFIDKSDTFENDKDFDSIFRSKNQIEKLTFKHRLILSTPFMAHSVISYGLMVFAQDTKRWAIIQRQHSIEFLLIIRGFYRPTFLKFLLSRITLNECLIIKTCLLDGPEAFKQLYLTQLGLNNGGLLYALVRMAESHNIIIHFISDIDLSKNILSWTWPKGRPDISNKREIPLESAKREFYEEVEIILPAPIFISNTFITENVTTITGRNIESRYWIYIIPKEIPMIKPKSHPEVADRLWVDTKLCYNMIPETLNHKSLFEHIINM